MSAVINVVCYKWKTLANGESPLMVRVAKSGKRTMQSLGISVNPKYWDFTRNKPKPNCPNKEYIQKIILDKQRELQQRMLELNIEQKEYTTTTLLNNEHTKFELKTVSEFYHELIEQYTREDKCGNRLIYKSSFNSLKVFTKGKIDIPFSDIDTSWLNKYEKWLRSKDNKETTISQCFARSGVHIIKLSKLSAPGSPIIRLMSTKSTSSIPQLKREPLPKQTC